METTTPNKERTNMREARLAAHLSQKQVAAKMGTHYTSINNWEKAHTTPQLSQIEPLMKAIKFTGTDDELLQVFLVEKPQESMSTDSETINICQEENTTQQMTTTCQATPNRAILKSSDLTIHIPGSVRGFRDFMEFARRQFIEVVAHFGLAASFGGMSLGLVSSPRVDPEEYLTLVGASIDTWWEWFNQGRFQKVEEVMSANVPILKRLAYTISPFQGMAANLAAQAKFLQMLLATRKGNFVWREIICAQAVHFGALSGNRGILATALDWQGNTYTLCYRQPQTAIPILNDALSVLNNESPLVKSGIYSNLSIAHAQEGDETEALKYAGMAISAMPTHSELDPFYQCIQFGPSELDQLEGKTYLCLAGHFPNSCYAELAYYTFEKSTSNPMNQGYLSGSLIKKADAARAFGDMGECVTCLSDGFHTAVEADSIRRINEARDVISNMPQEWKQETAVQKLQKEIIHAIKERSQAIIIARR